MGIKADPGLLRRLTDALEPRDEVLEAYLFGSLARGDAQPHSDVDVAVFVDPDVDRTVGWGLDSDLAAHLMDALQRNDVDLVLLNDAGPLLYHRVLRDGVRFLARDLRATTTREGHALSRYCDWLPQLDKIQRAEATARRKREARE